LDCHRRVRVGRLSTGCTRPPCPRDGDRIDPGRLIETAFRDRRRADDPETYVLAWLALLRPSADVPRAAATLKVRLMRECSGALTPWQRRLIELLSFVARHVRRRPAHALQSIALLSKKGMS
jgi:hypothetical protein